ncbi:MAG: hypothetical protein IPK33_06025 [Gemmatimonadetes bacterium]|nr:hypothetical protein [Gemmatimonadota bacterium]
MPVRAIVLVGTWASILALAGSYTQILGWAAFVNPGVHGAHRDRLLHPAPHRAERCRARIRSSAIRSAPLLYVAILLWYLDVA